MSGWQMPLAVIVIVGAPILGIYLAIKAYGGENGERYQKRQMQGPFVPLSQEDIAEDEENIYRRK